MNEPERFVIPGLPPTTNHGYGLCVKGNRAIMYKTDKAAAWQAEAYLLINAGKAHQDWGPCDIGVEITFRSKNKNRDIDGGVKPCLDIVACALGFNDKRVLKLVVHKAVGGKVQETEVEVWQIGGSDGGWAE